eukprot:5923597-Prymnesium_polylepis.2
MRLMAVRTRPRKTARIWPRSCAHKPAVVDAKSETSETTTATVPTPPGVSEIGGAIKSATRAAPGATRGSTTRIVQDGKYGREDLRCRPRTNSHWLGVLSVSARGLCACVEVTAALGASSHRAREPARRGRASQR